MGFSGSPSYEIHLDTFLLFVDKANPKPGFSAFLLDVLLSVKTLHHNRRGYRVVGCGPVGWDLITSRAVSFDQSRRPPPRTVRLMSVHPKRSVCLAEETILLRNGLEDPNEFFQKF
jgi:hypothetical protein